MTEDTRLAMEAGQPVDLGQYAENAYLAYAMSVVMGRALPMLQDGQKPVQRRIIYAMHRMGLTDKSKPVKCARVVGEVLGKYHPHGDCLAGDTLVYALDGRLIPLAWLVDNNIQDLWVLAHDEATGKPVPALAHSFRIGQRAMQTYRIHLSDGSHIEATANHQFLTDGGWVRAENLSAGHVIESGGIRVGVDGRPKFVSRNHCKPLHRLVASAQGLAGQVFHHIDHDEHNNAPWNLKPLTRSEHAAIHRDYLPGLEAGRHTMFGSPDSELARFNQAKNKWLRKAFNTKMPLIKAVNILRPLLAQHDRAEVTLEMYEAARKQGYLVSSVFSLQERGYVSSFDELLDLATQPVSEILGYTPDQVEAAYGVSRPATLTPPRNTSGQPFGLESAQVLKRAGKVLARMYQSPVDDFTWEAYETAKLAVVGKWNLQRDADPGSHKLRKLCDSLESLGRYAGAYSLVVTGVTQLTHSEAQPMYDFTVDGHENMYICSGDSAYTLCVAHNSSVYDAAVRMAQDFTLRYPLVDGQGNFGSRDGDSPAAMRYTEARLTPLAELLLGELDLGTVDFVLNYDGSQQEPVLMPARLPMLLLNGASGIAVGMATEIPSHNLTEVSLACEHLIRHPEATLADILAIMPGPDFAGGGQVISSPEDIAKAYATGRGSLRTRARWTVEPLARGQWQLAVTELPPDTSTAKVMSEIEALTNPQIKAGKKTLTQDQANLKALVLSVLDKISDDSDGEHPVRLVIEPRSSRQSPDEVMAVLLAHTSLEGNFSLNLVTIGQDGKPGQKGLLQVLQEWVAFRFETVTRRVTHRLAQVKARAHILEGRLAVFVHIDEIIALIRGAEDPKADLMRQFGLTEIQATDILEIRLRQLANLERLKLEGELAELKKEASFLQGLLDDRPAMTRQILKEIVEDRKKYGDARRTLIEPAARITTSCVVATSDDPVTLVVSKLGWLRARTGHKVDLSALTWKPGDEALAVFETRSTQTVVILDHTGRAYNVAASAFPTGRGDGAPLSSLVEIGPNKLAQALVLDTAAFYLLAHSGGYGFLCPGAELVTGKKAGKAVVTLESGETLLAPIALSACDQGGEVVVGSSAGKVLVFPLAELKQLAKGRGTQLMGFSGKDQLTLIAAYERPVTELTLTTSPTARKNLTEAKLAGQALQAYRGKRARAGVALPDKAVALSGQATLGDAILSTAVPAPQDPSAQPGLDPEPGAPTLSFGDEDLI